MVSKENSTSQETDASSKPPVKADGSGKWINTLPKALPVVEGKWEKPAVKPEENKQAPEKKPITPEQQKRIQAKDQTTRKYMIQKEQFENKKELIKTGKNLSSAFPWWAEVLDSASSLLDASVQNSEKQFVETLTSKHNADIGEKIWWEELSKMSFSVRDKAYRAMVEWKINDKTIPDFDKKKEELKKQLLEKDAEFKKLSPEDQEKNVRERLVETQTALCIWSIEEFNRLSPEDKKKPENLKKLQDSAGSQVNIWDLLQDETVKTQIIKNIQEKGMLESGVDVTSPLWQMLTGLARADYDAYMMGMSEKATLDDLPINIRQNLWLNKGFLREDEVLPTKMNREIQLLKNQFKTREGESAEESKKRIDDTVQKMGVSREKIEDQTRHFDIAHMDPSLKFLADLLAPLGAMLGGKSWEFWKKYLQESGANPNNPSGWWMLSDITNGVEGWKIDAQFSSDHEESVKRFIKEWPDPEYQDKISNTANSVERYKSRYQAVSDALKAKWKIIPWEAIGAIHEREWSLNFNTCLHNGDPLNQKTVHVPKWLWPFGSWEDAAIDALSRETYIDGMNTNTTLWLARVAEYCERYNGLGYRRKNRVSPYIWSGARFYTGGRYVADYKFSATSKDSRPGTMPVIMELAKKTPEFAGFQESKPEQLSKNDAVRWFQEHSWKSYWEWEGKYDCMTSTHAALWLDYTKQYAGAFNGKFIDQKDKDHNLWNVAMASALYVGNLTSANSDVKDGIIEKQPNGYYGEKSGNPANMEYYIEENVMKRVNDSADGIVDVGNSGKLIHYSKSKKWVSGIMDDIKNRLKPGESAMMGATGNGTNKGWHEWLIYNDNGTLKAYDATNACGQGVSGTWMELSSFLNDPRRDEYKKEAIIFAKRPQAVPVPQNLENSNSSPKSEWAKIDVFKTPGKVWFVGDSHFEIALWNNVPYTVLSGGNMKKWALLSVFDLVDKPEGRRYLWDKNYIVIGLWTNDAGNWPPEDMVQNMQNLIKLVRDINPNCKILIVTPPLNRDPNNSAIDSKIARYSILLQGTDLGENVTIADFYKESNRQNLALNNLNKKDGTHLRDYQPMRQFINDQIEGNQTLFASR